MKFSLESELAAKYGLVEAILLDYFVKWLRYNASKANAYNYRDGRYWVYDSSRKLAKKLNNIISEGKIRKSLCCLIDHGLMERSNEYNDKAYDNTFWYTLTEKGWSEVAKVEAGEDLDPSTACAPLRTGDADPSTACAPLRTGDADPSTACAPLRTTCAPLRTTCATIPNLSPINPPITSSVSLPIDRRDKGEINQNFQKTIQGQIIPKNTPVEVQQRLDYFIKNFRPFKNVNEAEEIYQIAASSTDEEFTYAVDAAVGKAKYKPWRYIETVIKNYRESKAEEEAPAAKKPRKKKGSQDLQTSYENVMRILEESGDFDE